MIRVCTLLAASVLLLSSLKAEPSLRGIIRMQTTTLFAVCDEASGRSAWARPASVLQDAIADIEREMAASKAPADRLFLEEIVAGLKAGDVRIISTEGKPLRREDHPEMSQEKFDRINKLMQMTPEQVQALIDSGTDPNKQAIPAK
ncbi:MAG TPA: hypothetical protein VK178_12225 [Opitutaceae bacterium]|nr:hypothetical protein [Opitutaceae bacterium]